MTFDEAFRRVIGHEGGLEFVDGTKNANVAQTANKSGSHRKRHRKGASQGGDRSIVNLRSASQFSGLRVLRSAVLQAGIRGRLLQCPLPASKEGRRHGCACAGQQARWDMRSLRRRFWRKGWLGNVPGPLQSRAICRRQGCRGKRHGWQVPEVLRRVPARRIRLSPHWHQDREPKRDAGEQIGSGDCLGAGEVHVALRQLPPHGARR